MSYEASNRNGGLGDTPWPWWKGARHRVTLQLGDMVPVRQLGLVPGCAKTGEKSNADCFARRNRVKRVRWTVGRRKSVRRMKGSPEDRNLQLIRGPRGSTVEREILAVEKCPRNKPAISELQINRAD